RVVAVASQTAGKAETFAADFSIEKAYASYEEMLADPGVEAVYVGNIHPQHEEWVIKAAEAGKHILVEKPIGLNTAEAEAMIDAARRNDVFLMEAFMYRCSPQTERLAELVRSGVIGPVRMIRSVFAYKGSFDPSRRTFSPEMGGGGILDVGCYPVSMARLIAGAAAGKAFLDPVDVKACGVLGPSGVDHYTAATLKFENDIVAEVITGVTVRMSNETTIYGDDGMISVPNAWLPSSPCRPARLPIPLDTPFPSTSFTLHVYAKGQPEEIVVDVDRDLFTYEADMVAAHIAQRQAPAMSWDDTLGNMRTLDRWREEIGLVYPGE
ncbi:MAG: Gfo/Idh/MocA family oxidoreductase, partial [Caldilineaceae bacterium]